MWSGESRGIGCGDSLLMNGDDEVGFEDGKKLLGGMGGMSRYDEG